MDIKVNFSGRAIKYTEDEIAVVVEAMRNAEPLTQGKHLQAFQKAFGEYIGAEHCFAVMNGVSALELSAQLCNFKPGDEVVIPSHTFTASAYPYAKKGAKLVWADVDPVTHVVNAETIEKCITPRTKAIVVVHLYGYVADMPAIMEVAKRHNVLVIEDAAQAIDSYYKGKSLGALGDLGCFSFHDTKNITAGEGGMLVINNPDFFKRAEILWEKGTNRSEFFRGEVNKYGWVDTGSSFLLSELNAALLFSQLEKMEEIQRKRLHIWNIYDESLKKLEEKNLLSLQKIPEYATNNAHMFYMVCNTPEERTQLIEHLKKDGIHAVFHYLSLHKSKYAQKHHLDEAYLPMSDYYTERLVRLPMFYSMSDEDVNRVVYSILNFFD